MTSLAKGYRFLYEMMDKYASGSRLRLVQSFEGGVLGRRHFTDSVTYDDALIIDALLARGTPADVSHAQVIGNSLLYVQAHDKKHDGRVRAAYAPTPLSRASKIEATDRTSDVGNMAWVGQALVQLYARTRRERYLEGATAVGEWIQTNARDIRGAGGYTGGYDADGAKIKWKSTEHNLDVFSFFTLLGMYAHQAVWTKRALWARRFVVAMWNAQKRMFYVGTGTNGVTINRDFRAEDVNSWSYLALRDPSYAASLEWDIRHLSVSRGRFRGVSFCAGDRSGVWFEGTAHLADALELRNSTSEAVRARAYLRDVAHAQTAGPNSNGLGVIAASKNHLSDCDGSQYFASLHTGATSWYLLALQKADPFIALK